MHGYDYVRKSSIAGALFGLVLAVTAGVRGQPGYAAIGAALVAVFVLVAVCMRAIQRRDDR